MDKRQRAEVIRECIQQNNDQVRLIEKRASVDSLISGQAHYAISQLRAVSQRLRDMIEVCEE